MKTDHKYLTFTKYLSENTFDLCQVAQTVKLLLDTNAFTNKFQGLRHVKLNLQDTHLLLQIGYNICPADAINKANIHMSLIKYIIVMHSVLSTNLYVMAHMLNIKKRHWKRYHIMQKKSHQHKHYGMGGTSKHEIGKYESGKYRTSKHWHLATFRKSYQCCNIDKWDVGKCDVRFLITGL